MEFPFAKGSEEYDYDAIKMMPEKQALKSISLTDGKVVDNQDYKAPLGINAFEYADQITMTLPLSAKETMFHSVSFLDQYDFNFTAKDYNTAYTSISNYLRNDSGFAKSVANNLYSPRMNNDSVRVLLLILKIIDRDRQYFQYDLDQCDASTQRICYVKVCWNDVRWI